MKIKIEAEGINDEAIKILVKAVKNYILPTKSTISGLIISV